MEMQARNAVLTGNSRANRLPISLESGSKVKCNELSKHQEHNHQTVTPFLRRSSRLSIVPNRYSDAGADYSNRSQALKKKELSPNHLSTPEVLATKRCIIYEVKSIDDKCPQTLPAVGSTGDCDSTGSLTPPEAHTPGVSTRSRISPLPVRRRSMAALRKAAAARVKEAARFEVTRQQIQSEIPFELRKERDLLKRKVQETEPIVLEKNLNTLKMNVSAELTELSTETKLKITQFREEILNNMSSDEVEEIIGEFSVFNPDLHFPGVLLVFGTGLFEEPFEPEFEFECEE